MYFTLRSYLLAALATITLAQVRLDPIPGTLQAGEAIDISWTTDQDYVLKLVLARRDLSIEGWHWIHTIFENETQKAGEGSWQWLVPTLRSDREFAVRLEAVDPKDESNDAAYMSPFFDVRGGPGSDHGLSKGAIAGIVVGSVLGVCLIALGTFFGLRRLRRKGHTTKRGLSVETDPQSFAPTHVWEMSGQPMESPHEADRQPIEMASQPMGTAPGAPWNQYGYGTASDSVETLTENDYRDVKEKNYEMP